MSEAGVTADAVNKVIVCGGGMHIPQLQSMLAARLNQAEMLNSLMPDEVTAIGAAQQVQTDSLDTVDLSYKLVLHSEQ